MTLGFLLVTRALTSVKEDSIGLSFQVSSGGNYNYFLRDNITSAQLLLTNDSSAGPSGFYRLVAALPAGNTGALVYFLPSVANTTFSVDLVNGTLNSTTDEYNNTGIQADLTFSGGARLGVTIIGAVRAMRGVFYR